MDRTTVYTKLASSGIPVAHMCFPVKEAPALPWCVFYSDEDTTFCADDFRYLPKCILTVELYEKYANETTETTLENVLSDLGVWEKTEQWVESENCLMVVYRLSVKG